MEELMSTVPGMNMLIGDGGPDGSNLLASLMASPTRELSKSCAGIMRTKRFGNSAFQYTR